MTITSAVVVTQRDGQQHAAAVTVLANNATALDDMAIPLLLDATQGW